MTSPDDAETTGHQAELDAELQAELQAELDAEDQAELDAEFAAGEGEPIEFEPSDPIAAARRRHGAAGAIVAAGMLGLEQVLGRKPKQEAPVVVAAPTEPIDVDRDGIAVVVDDELSLVAPPLPRTAPINARTKRNGGRNTGSTRRR
jgi:hypothetical protein